MPAHPPFDPNLTPEVLAQMQEHLTPDQARQIKEAMEAAEAVARADQEDSPASKERDQAEEDELDAILDSKVVNEMAGFLAHSGNGAILKAVDTYLAKQLPWPKEKRAKLDAAARKLIKHYARHLPESPIALYAAAILALCAEQKDPNVPLLHGFRKAEDPKPEPKTEPTEPKIDKKPEPKGKK